MLKSDILDLFFAKIGVWRLDEDKDFLTLPDFESVNPFRWIQWLYAQETEKAGKSRIFVKENQIYRFALVLEHFFPTAKYVYMIRDPRDMALSWKKAAALRGGVVRASNTWKNDQEGFLQMASWLGLQNRVFMLRYEDLITSPQPIIEDLCQFLEVDFSESMLEFYRHEHIQKNASAVNEWGNTNKPLMHDNSEKYKTGLSEEEGSYVETLCGDLMKQFHYAPYFPTSTDFNELHTRLAAVEPYTKAAYDLVSETEKKQREKWQAIVARVSSQPIPQPV